MKKQRQTVKSYKIRQERGRIEEEKKCQRKGKNKTLNIHEQGKIREQRKENINKNKRRNENKQKGGKESREEKRKGNNAKRKAK